MLGVRAPKTPVDLSDDEKSVVPEKENVGALATQGVEEARGGFHAQGCCPKPRDDGEGEEQAELAKRNGLDAA